MEKIKTNIEIYSDILEDDITIEISVNYEIQENFEFEPWGKYGEERERKVDDSALFVATDVTILTDLPIAVRDEFYTNFENYESTIAELIENEINE